MANANEQLGKLSQSYLDNAVQFGQISLQGLERLTKFGLDSSKHLFDLQQQAWESLVSTDDPAQTISQISKLAEQSLQEALAQSEAVYKIVANTQGKLTEVVNKSAGAVQEAVHLVLDELTQQIRTH